MLTFFQVFITIYGTAMSLGPAVQAYRIWRRKSSSDVSLFSLGLIGLGVYFWLLWGILSSNPPLIVANASACLTYALALVATIAYRKPSI
jgi:uncharacterized protein with PQ loop repeat